MVLKDEIAAVSSELCERYGLKRLGIFGSVARGDATGRSDIDFYAEFDDPVPETMPGRYFGFIDEVARRFNRPVQVLTPGMIRNPFLKRSIFRDLIIVHE